MKKKAINVCEYGSMIVAMFALAYIVFAITDRFLSLGMNFGFGKPILLRVSFWLVFAALVIAFVLFIKYVPILKLDEKIKKGLVIGVYCLLILYFIFQMKYYEKNCNFFSDEIQHISYVEYMEKNRMEIIPKYENVKVLNGGVMSQDIEETWEIDQTNYLGHPPLYYKIMTLCNGIKFDGDKVIVNLSRLRVFTQFLAVFGLSLALYIGYTRIRKTELQLLYGVIITGLPYMAFNCAGVTNDTLSILGINILLLGLLRFTENKRRYLTFFLVALGLFICLLNKLTVGAMGVIAVLCFCLIVCIREKSLKIIFNKYFLASSFIYVLILGFYLVIFVRYNTFQVSLKDLNYEQYIHSGFVAQEGAKNILPLKTFIRHFKNMFLLTWSGWASNGWSLVKTYHWLHLDVFAVFGMLYASVLCLGIRVRDEKLKENQYAVKSFLVGIIFTMIYHVYTLYKSHLETGYLGACSSRYYICAIAVFAFANVLVIEKMYELIKSNRKLKASLGILILTFCILLWYEGFPYFILNFKGL